MKRLLSLIGLIALLALPAAYLAGPERLKRVCASVGLCERTDVTGAMLVAFQKQNRLTVFAARLVEALTSSRDITLLPGGTGPVLETVRLTSIVPADVTYSIDMSSLQRQDLDWDAASQTLRVRRPAVQVGAPAVRWELAQHYSDGSVIADLNKADTQLVADNQKAAPSRFTTLASSRDLTALADAAADEALANSFRLPLAALGFADAKVVVTR